MKFAAIFPVPLLLLIACLLSGCATSPVAKVTQANDIFAETLHLLADARDNGVLTPAQIEQMKPWLSAAKVALAQAEESAKAGNDSYRTYLDSFFAANQYLLNWHATTQRKE